ncbi:MAG: hypothetical protein K8I29_03870 [Alphaproteobacteria bacterium]|uniref:Uncharacterized protein n=1 Tax=Candidatus Nitrobium versatile TaxID=2884831 RepID=A0A953J663_9BACT|nr:hypothetical protein [Candidatus Nitrobium versatile]
MKGVARAVFSLLVGLAVGTVFAKLSFPGYTHATVVIRKGGAPKPLSLNGTGGRQVLALSMKNLQKSREIGIRMEGAEIQSWYPPVVRMPFNKGISFEEGIFSGVEPGKRIPVYIVFTDNGKNRKIEVVDPTEGSLIQTIDILRGQGDAEHRH